MLLEELSASVDMNRKTYAIKGTRWFVAKGSAGCPLSQMVICIVCLTRFPTPFVHQVFDTRHLSGAAIVGGPHPDTGRALGA